MEKAARLEKPVRITEQVWQDGTVPVVSVFCVAFNHEKFIRDAIEGFLMQETTFPVEIFIHDDASTDCTADIVREYAAKYRKLFWTVLQTENQWSKGNHNTYFLGWVQKQRGEFIAFCEGDDYWTNPHKLQKQVELLVADSNAIGAFHQVQLKRPAVMSPENLTPINTPPLLSFEDIVCSNLRATCSMMFRRDPACTQDLLWMSGLPMGDWPLQVALATVGHWRYLSETMAVYRIHSDGVWIGLDDYERNVGVLQFYNAVESHFGARASVIVGKQRKELQAWLMSESLSRNDFRSARHHLAEYFFTSPRRFTFPSYRKRDIFRTLGSLFYGW